MRDDRERLLDILEAIERAEKYASQGKEAFLRDELVQVWILHHLQIIGEATRALDASFREAFPEIPWTKIVGMRNILIHQYFEIDTEIVWAVVEDDLPSLKEKIQAALEGSDGL
ncbi:MAG TPA: DUF86 domain-containing protein [Thermoanaerobaculia bacterium]|nr:DUF86 domain-containing protein [Thermoanaerobaculia bacterium]